jgi:hypothetical protein
MIFRLVSRTFSHYKITCIERLSVLRTHNVDGGKTAKIPLIIFGK